MIPHYSLTSPDLTKSDEEPTSFTPVGNEADLIRCSPSRRESFAQVIMKLT
jgi:hypothetical protein